VAVPSAVSGSLAFTGTVTLTTSGVSSEIGVPSRGSLGPLGALGPFGPPSGGQNLWGEFRNRGAVTNAPIQTQMSQWPWHMVLKKASFGPFGPLWAPWAHPADARTCGVSGFCVLAYNALVERPGVLRYRLHTELVKPLPFP
jgi:hypothetical protein